LRQQFVIFIAVTAVREEQVARQEQQDEGAERETRPVVIERCP
jgi:hypothetical protein